MRVPRARFSVPIWAAGAIAPVFAPAPKLSAPDLFPAAFGAARVRDAEARFWSRNHGRLLLTQSARNPRRYEPADAEWDDA